MSSSTSNSSLSSEVSSSKRKSDTVTAEEPRTTGITMPGNQGKASSAAVAELPTAAATVAITRPTDIPDNDRGENLGKKVSTQFPVSRKQIDHHTDLPLELRPTLPRRGSSRARQSPPTRLLARHQGRPSPYQNLHPELRIQDSAGEA